MNELITSLRELFDFDDIVENYIKGRINFEEKLIEEKGCDYFYEIITSIADKKIKKKEIIDIYNKHLKKKETNKDDLNSYKLDKPINISNYWKENNFSNYKDPYIDIRTKPINYNTDIPISESIKLKKEKEKEKQKQLNLFNEWKNNKIRIPPPIRVHNLLNYGEKSKNKIEKLSDIKIDNFNLSIGQRCLLNDTTLKINAMTKYGLIGKNGIGKSTLLAKLAKYEVDEIKKDISIACIEQEIFFDDVTVLECVLMVDKIRHDLLKELEELEMRRKNLIEGKDNIKEESKKNKKKETNNIDNKNKEIQMNEKNDKDLKKNENTKEASLELDMKIMKIYEKLHNIFYLEAEKEASKILCGLGFDYNLQRKKVNSLSGGMKMRLCLARILFSNNDIILLDEPTNHLDIYTIQFLINYIQKLEKTCIIVSHDRNFLNEVCTDIIHFHNKTLTYYKGNYDQFEKTRMEHLLQQQREFDAMEMKKKHVQKFIDRFRCNAKLASLVQSRIKLLEKLPVISLEKEENPFNFFFLEPSYTSNVLIRLSNVSFKNEMFKMLQTPEKECNFILNNKKINVNAEKEDENIRKTVEYQFNHEYLFKNASFEVDMSSRIAICGVNGSGKSTLIKIILNLINVYEGDVMVSNKANIGYYSQYHVDNLNPVFNSIEQLQHNYKNKNIKEEEAIKHFNKFNIPSNLLYEPIYVLSGGQKTKLTLAILAYKNPNILILDEPTNHLDIESVQSLIVALNLYKGGLVVVSHDMYLIKHVADHIYHINNFTREVIKINYELEKYTKMILESKI